jgi:hypothetical protein
MSGTAQMDDDQIDVTEGSVALIALVVLIVYSMVVAFLL